MKTKQDRRQFIKTTAVAGLGLGFAKLGSPLMASGTHAHSPGSKITIAAIGTNSRGDALAETFAQLPNVEVLYVCDPDERVMAKTIKTCEKAQGKTPKGLKDFRKALEDPDLDAVFMATPDHWHTPGAIMALNAGKHVYLEKPCGYNPAEGEMLIEAVGKHKLVYQMGIQRRSSTFFQNAIQEIHEGIIGRAYMGKCWYANSRKSIGYGKPAEIPSWLDYELWQGPAPRRPYQDNVIHYNWHWFKHWGTGESCNNATHEIDVCRWALEVEYPTKVTSSGGRYHFEDDWEYYDTQILGFEFSGRKSIAWESRSCSPFNFDQGGRGSVIFGDGGAMFLNSDEYRVYDMDKKLVKQVKSASEGGGVMDTRRPNAVMTAQHCENFIDSIRGDAQPNSPVLDGHQSVLLCHLGNISQATGRALHCDQKNGHILNDPEAMKYWSRDYEPGWEPKV